MANTLRRDPYWFDRILEEITYKFDPEDPRHRLAHASSPPVTTSQYTS